MVKKNHNPLKKTKTKTKARSNATKKKYKPLYHLTHDSAELWDKHLSKDQNYARLGIAYKQNLDQVRDNKKQVEKLLDLIPVEKLDEMPEPKPSAGPKNKDEFPPGERLALDKFIEKYGNDYKKMSMDHKLNKYQMTPKKLEKRILKYNYCAPTEIITISNNDQPNFHSPTIQKVQKTGTSSVNVGDVLRRTGEFWSNFEYAPNRLISKQSALRSLVIKGLAGDLKIAQILSEIKEIWIGCDGASYEDRSLVELHIMGNFNG
eukprot:gene6120-10129_t